MSFSYVLVTGSTGFVGAHVVDNLLSKGIRVRAIARSKTKAEHMTKARAQFAQQLDFCFIDDLTTPGVFDDAVKEVDGVIHVASPLKYDVTDNENELIIPAIKGVQSILEASAKSKIRRVVMTSSFGAVLDMARDENCPWTYSSRDWNPITYNEASNPATTPQDAYRGSKVFAEREAWKFMKERKPQFDLVTLCPSMIFGPVAGSLNSSRDLNESNTVLWKVASGDPSQPLPPSRFNFWTDVRDLAEIHVQALLIAATGGKRYLPISPEKFTYGIASEIIAHEFPGWAKLRVSPESQVIKKDVNVDMEDMERDFSNIKYRPFRDCVTDFVKQVSLVESA